MTFEISTGDDGLVAGRQAIADVTIGEQVAGGTVGVRVHGEIDRRIERGRRIASAGANQVAGALSVGARAAAASRATPHAAEGWRAAADGRAVEAAVLRRTAGSTRAARVLGTRAAQASGTGATPSARPRGTHGATGTAVDAQSRLGPPRLTAETERWSGEGDRQQQQRDPPRNF